MKKAEEFLEKALSYASAAAGQRHLQAMREAMIHVVPLTLVSSVFVLAARFPWAGYQDFMTRLLGTGWQSWESVFLRPALLGIIAYVGAVSAATSLSKSYGDDGTQAGILGLAAFALLTVQFRIRGGDADGMTHMVSMEAAVSQVGFEGRQLWLAMLCGLAAAELQHRAAGKQYLKKLPPAFARSIEPMFPLLLVVLLFGGIRVTGSLVIGAVYGASPSELSFCDIWMSFVQRPLFRLGTSLPATLFLQAANSFFWGLGLHGAQLVNAVMLPVWSTQMMENLQTFTTGGAVMPNIVTKQFIELFIWIGGSAGSLSLVLWIKLFARSKHVKQIGKMALIPALFNIDEPIVFGLPVALNPILIIPFILAPLATTAFSYLTMRLGIFPIPCGIDLPWTTPVLLGGFLATGGNPMGAVLQICNMVISFMIYTPFIYVYDKRMAETEI